MLTLRESRILRKIIRLQKNPGRTLRMNIKSGLVTFMNPDTNSEVRSPYPAEETLEILKRLSAHGYIDPLNIPYKEWDVTTIHYSSYHTKEIIVGKILDFILRSILVPVIVALITSLLSEK